MTALLLPTDGCPACLTAVPVHPFNVDLMADSRCAGAAYRCPECSHQWWTGWDISALDVPCPGCPSCRAGCGCPEPSADCPWCAA
jgi:hypothetical protein